MSSGARSVVVLACGSTLRGDDGVAWRIAEALEVQPVAPGVEVIFTELLLPEHAAMISGAELVIFLDCSAVTAPGEVSTIRLQPASQAPRIFTHHLDPASLLRLSLELYGSVPPDAAAITVGGESFELSEAPKGQLSASVEAAIPVAVETIRRVMQGPEPRDQNQATITY